jgi:hypothetical protein
LALGALGEGALLDLAREWAPALADAERRRAVARSSGSPWRLRQALSGGGTGLEGADLLSGVPARATELLEVLSLLEVPLPLEELGRAVAVPDPPVLEQLERRGLLERTPGGCRLHGVAGAILRPSLGERAARQWAQPLAAELARSGDPPATVEAVRLYLGHGRVGEALDLLGREGERCFAAGYAPRLWAALEPIADERLAHWRLRCAVEIGDPAALSRISLPARPAPAERLLWARALFLAARFAESEEAAGATQDQASAAGNASLAVDAGLVRAQSLWFLGRPQEARALLGRLAPTGRGQAALLDAYAARCLERLGEYAEAVRLAERAADTLLALAPPLRWVVLYELAASFFSMGRIRSAARVLAEGGVHGPDESLALHKTRYTLLCRAGVALGSGDLGDARLLLERLRPFAERSSMLHPIITAIELLRRSLAGEFEGDVEAVEQLVAAAQSAGNVYFYYAAMVMRAYLAALRAWPDVDLPEPARALAASGFDAGFLQVSLLQHRVRRGDDLRAEARAWVERVPEVVGLHVIARSVAAQAALVAGDPEGALGDAMAAIRVAGELGLHFLLEADARQILCEILLVAGRRAELAQAAGRLLAMAEAAGSLRFTLEAKLLLFGASEEVPAPAVLEDLAGRSHAAPGLPLVLVGAVFRQAAERKPNQGVVPTNEASIQLMGGG